MSEDIRIKFKQLEDKSTELNQKLGYISGQCKLLEEQINNSNNKLNNLIRNKGIYKKAIEILTLFQQVNRDMLKKGFESVVTYALRYIFNADYKFELEFGRRGNLQELDFNIQTPDFKGQADPIDTSGGGILDILSLALRVSLLSLNNPKIEGFLVLDEPFKHVSEKYLENCRKFVEVINEKINRQIIMVTHKEEFKKQCKNIIEIKGGK